MQPLKALNCGIGGDKVQHVLWRTHNLPVRALRSSYFMWYNLNQDSPEDITDGIKEVASTFKSKYGSISILICGILARD